VAVASGPLGRPRVEARHFTALYWLVLAAAIMPGVAFLKPIEFFALALAAATISSAFFFPTLRAPLLLVCVLLFPRTVEYDPNLSWVLGLREPAKDVRIVAGLSFLDLAIVVTGLSVVLPKLFQRRPILSHGGGWGLAFVGVYLCSTLLAAGHAGPPYDVCFVALVNLLRLLLVWVVFVNADLAKGNTQRLVLAFFLCGVVACCSGVTRYLFTGPVSVVEAWEARATPFNMNSNSFAATMMMLGVAGAVLLCVASARRDRLLGLALLLSAAAGTGVALSRAGIGIFVALVTWLFLRYRARYLLPWFVGLALVTVYVLTTPDVNGRIALFQSGARVMEDNVRGVVYQQTGSMIADNWVLGVGPYNYFDASIPHIPVGLVRNVAHAHSLPLELLVETGVFGALFGMLLFVTWLRRAGRFLRSGLPDHAWRLGAAYAIVGSLIFQITDSLMLDYRFAATWLALAAVLVTGRPGGEEERRVAVRGVSAASRRRPTARWAGRKAA
jgi:hypothetical protein